MRAEYKIGSGTYDDELTVSGEMGSNAATVELAFEYPRRTVTLERHNAEGLHAALTLLLNLKPDGGYVRAETRYLRRVQQCRTVKKNYQAGYSD